MKKLIISILSLLMAVSLTACSSDKEETFKFSGADTANRDCQGYVQSDKITAVESKPRMKPKASICGSEELPEKIVAANSADVDVVAGATMTSKAIQSAVRQAVSKKNGEKKVNSRAFKPAPIPQLSQVTMVRYRPAAR